MVNYASGQCALSAKSLCVRLPIGPRPCHYAVRYLATFTLYSQIDIWNVRRSCQCLIDFIRWPSKVRGATFFLHFWYQCGKERMCRIMALTLLGVVSGHHIELVDGDISVTWLLVSWVYLRFYQRHSNGNSGDMAESFTFASFFPHSVQPFVGVVSSVVFVVLVKLTAHSSLKATCRLDRLRPPCWGFI